VEKPRKVGIFFFYFVATLLDIGGDPDPLPLFCPNFFTRHNAFLWDSNCMLLFVRSQHSNVNGVTQISVLIVYYCLPDGSTILNGGMHSTECSLVLLVFHLLLSLLSL